MDKAFFSTSEAARLFNINRVTVYRWIKEGKLTAHKIGMRFKVPSSEVARLLRSSGLSGPSPEGGNPPGRSQGVAGREPQEAGAEKRQKLVLVIDRDRDVHGFIEACFEELGLDGTCRLKAFSSSIEAALQLGRDDPDVVLLDVMMPDLDGLELARKIRAAHGKARIVLMTLNPLDPGNGDAFETLVKPLNLKKLNQAIGDYLR